MNLELRIKKIISVLTITILLMMPNTTLALDTPAAPTPPSAPTAPPAPAAPSAPEAPAPPPTPPAPPAQPSPPSLQPASAPSPINNPSPSAAPALEPDNTSINNPSPSSSPTSNQTGQAITGNNGTSTISTGSITNSGIINSAVNNNLQNSSENQAADLPGSNTTIQNTDNGTGSTNNSSATATANNTTDQNNGAAVDNSLTEAAITGGNSASLNVGDSIIKSGSANTSGTIITGANTNFSGVSVAEFNVVDDTQGNLVLDFAKNCISGCESSESIQNVGNGADSVNTASSSAVTDNTILQDNSAAVTSNLNLKANSGSNTASQNTGGDSSISSGDANISGNVLTFLNNNLAGRVVLGIVNIFGNLIGDIVLPDQALSCNTCTGDTSVENSGNGVNSTNNASSNQTTSQDTAQFNNADIQNNLILTASTGDNQTNENTGGNSSVRTGNASAQSQTVNIANSNVDGGNWWLVIVNYAGQWVGQILGAPEGSNMAGSSGTTFVSDNEGNITVSNSGNGAGSTNNANTNSNTNNTIIQNNNAKIVNNIDLSANTGRNSASQNTEGNSEIRTGDAKVIANLINFVNNNISGGGKIVVTLVNVFGGWIGDFVAPGTHKDPQPTTDSSSANVGGLSPASSTIQTSNEPTSLNSSAGNDASENPSSTTPSPLLSTTQSAPPLFVNHPANPPIQSTQVAGLKIVAGNNIPSIQPPDSHQKVTITLNLAWLLPLFPLAILLFKLRRKPFAIKQILKQTYD